MSDYLAVIMFSSGGGSWYRDADRDKAIKGAARICKQDWKSLMAFPKGKEIKVCVVDVDGFDEVEWSDNGFFVWDKSQAPPKRTRIDRPVDIVTHTY